MSQSSRGFLESADEECQILVLVVPEHNYTEKILAVVADMVGMGINLCYISLNRPCSSLMSTFKKAGVNTDSIHFIDAITKTAVNTEDTKQCSYVSSPGALTELSVKISKIVDKKEYDYIIFDSLSTLLVYESDSTIAKFVHFLMAKVRVASCNAIFTCLNQDAESILIKDINMFADKVIDMEKWSFKI